MSLVGPGGLLNQLTRNVLETALEAELTEHLGRERGGSADGCEYVEGDSGEDGADRGRPRRDRGPEGS